MDRGGVEHRQHDRQDGQLRHPLQEAAGPPEAVGCLYSTQVSHLRKMMRLQEERRRSSGLPLERGKHRARMTGRVYQEPAFRRVQVAPTGASSLLSC